MKCLIISIWACVLPSVLALKIGPDVSRRNIVFAAHHKTGSVLALHSSRCVGNVSIEVEQHMCHNSDHCQRTSRVVHFMRDLPSLVLSAYLYHKNTGEPWSRSNGSARVVLRGHPGHVFDYYDHESYTNYLLRAPVEKGVLAEMARFQHGSVLQQDQGLDEIKLALDTCKVAAANCMTVCLEEFAETYTDTWKKVFQFADVRADQ